VTNTPGLEIWMRDSVRKEDLLHRLLAVGWRLEGSASFDIDDGAFEFSVLTVDAVIARLAAAQHDRKIASVAIVSRLNFGGHLIFSAETSVTFSVTINRPVTFSNLTDVTKVISEVIGPCIEQIERFEWTEDVG